MDNMIYHNPNSESPKISQLKGYAKALEVSDIANEVLDHPKFALWSGSGLPEQHHYGDGGLLQHTFEVIELCITNNNLLRDFNHNLNAKDLFLAALFHDIGKTWDYICINNIWQYAPHKRIIHHISRSAIIWSAVAEKHGYNPVNTENVLHAILGHHGLREYGSPVTPKTKIAFLLHLCDSISARMADCEINKIYE